MNSRIFFLLLCMLHGRFLLCSDEIACDHGQRVCFSDLISPEDKLRLAQEIDQKNIQAWTQLQSEKKSKAIKYKQMKSQSKIMKNLTRGLQFARGIHSKNQGGKIIPSGNASKTTAVHIAQAPVTSNYIFLSDGSDFFDEDVLRSLILNSSI